MPSAESCDVSVALIVVPHGVPLTSFTVYPTEVELPACTVAELGLSCICEEPMPAALAYPNDININASSATVEAINSLFEEFLIPSIKPHV